MKLRTHNYSIQSNAVLRRELFENREHFVFPAVLVREMILNRVFTPAEEISKFIESWNGVPLTISHPRVNGQLVSANSPRILETFSFGRLFNVMFDGTALHGELWIDTRKVGLMKQDARDVVKTLESSQRLEVSTGFFAEIEDVNGTFNGEDFSGIYRNIVPDHLALLPNEIGACSWADGCGAPRTNTEVEMSETKELQTPEQAVQPKVEESKDREIHTNSNSEEAGLVAKTLSVLYKMGLLKFAENTNDSETKEDITNQKEIEGACNSTVNNNSCGCNKSTNENHTEVKPNEGVSESEDVNMEKKELVDSIITNESSGFTEDDREYLMTLSDDRLHKFAPAANEESDEEVQEEVQVKSEEAAVEPTKESAVETQSEKQSPWAFEGIDPNEVKEILSTAVAESKRQRDLMIKEIVANSEFKEKELKAKPSSELKTLHRLAVKDADYSGIGFPRSFAVNKSEDEIPAPPAVIFGFERRNSN